MKVNSEIDVKIDFGNRIRELRIERKWTQDDLADKSNISVRNISDIENGKVDCHLTTLYLLANAFDISMAELLNL